MTAQDDRFLDWALLNVDPKLVKANINRLIHARQQGAEALRVELVKIQEEAKSS